MSHPGRHDKTELATGIAGSHLATSLKPFNRFACDIRTFDEKQPYLEGTKCVLLMGVTTLEIVGQQGKSVSAMRGSVFPINGIPHIPTFHPQDAVDRKDYESTLNKFSENYHDPDDEWEDEDDDEEEGTGKDKSKTSRRNYRFWFRADCQKAIDIVRRGYKPNTCTYLIRPPINAAIEVLRSTAGRHLFIDIENDPETHTVKCIGFGFDATKVWTVPLVNYDGSYAYPRSELARFIQALCVGFLNNTVVCHNGLHDLFILLWQWGIIPPPSDKIEDTMIMWHRCFPEIEKSLGHVISYCTHEIYHKDEGIFYTHNHKQDEQFWLYNAKDVERTALCHERLKELANEIGATESCKQGNAYTRTVLTKMLRGVRVDTDKLCKRIDYIEATKDFFEKKVLNRLVGYDINPRSVPAVTTYLYDELQVKDAKGKLTKLKRPENDSPTGKKTLYKILTKHDVPALKLILALRRFSTEQGKLKSKLWMGNRIVGTYGIASTKSFRLSSKKLLGEFGTNMQNFNKRTKVHVIPDSGSRLLQVDLDGVEAFIVAYLCPPGGRFRQLFINKVKPHTYVAFRIFFKHWCEVFDRDLSDILTLEIGELKKHPLWKELAEAIQESDEDIPSRRFYYFAKQTCHSANYDIKAPKFVMNVLDKSDGEVVIPLIDGMRYLNEYHNMFPELRGGFHAYVSACLEYNMTLTNLFGFPRKFHGVLDDDLRREAYSWIPQSTGSGVLAQIAATQIQTKFERGEIEPFFSILQNNHDSILTQVKIGREQEAAKIICEHMNVTLTNPYGEQFTLRSTPQTGDNWKEMKTLIL